MTYSNEIQIAKPEVCLTKPIKEPSDIGTIPYLKTHKLGLDLGQDNHGSNQSLEDKYIKLRGHIRNKESNLNIHIKILQPNEFIHSEVPKENVYSSEVRKDALNKELHSTTPNSERKANATLISNAKRLEAKKKTALLLELSKYPELRSKLRKQGIFEELSCLSPKSIKSKNLNTAKSENDLLANYDSKRMMESPNSFNNYIYNSKTEIFSSGLCSPSRPKTSVKRKFKRKNINNLTKRPESPGFLIRPARKLKAKLKRVLLEKQLFNKDIIKEVDQKIKTIILNPFVKAEEIKL